MRHDHQLSLLHADSMEIKGNIMELLNVNAQRFTNQQARDQHPVSAEPRAPTRQGDVIAWPMGVSTLHEAWTTPARSDVPVRDPRRDFTQWERRDLGAQPRPGSNMGPELNEPPRHRTDVDLWTITEDP